METLVKLVVVAFVVMLAISVFLMMAGLLTLGIIYAVPGLGGPELEFLPTMVLVAVVMVILQMLAGD